MIFINGTSWETINWAFHPHGKTTEIWQLLTYLSLNHSRSLVPQFPNSLKDIDDTLDPYSFNHITKSNEHPCTSHSRTETRQTIYMIMIWRKFSLENNKNLNKTAKLRVMREDMTALMHILQICKKKWDWLMHGRTDWQTHPFWRCFMHQKLHASFM